MLFRSNLPFNKTLIHQPKASSASLAAHNAGAADNAGAAEASQPMSLSIVWWYNGKQKCKLRVLREEVHMHESAHQEATPVEPQLHVLRLEPVHHGATVRPLCSGNNPRYD